MGLFITFEGIEGSGKSTQIKLLAEGLKEKGKEPLLLREPGGTELGERIRPLLLNDSTDPIDPITELMLYEAARAELVSKVIKPALKEGRIVLSDRFTDSTLAYQGFGRGLDRRAVESANDLATGGMEPDVTVLLDIDAEAGLKRALERIENSGAKEGEREDRFEKEALEFHERVREGFLKVAENEPERVRVVDASRAPEEIAEEILAFLEPLID